MRFSLIGCALISGCAGLMKPSLDAMFPPGQMSADGKINPCHGYANRPQDCGNAIFFAGRIAKVEIGQDREAVRRTMMRDPERREVVQKYGRAVETWAYLTDYASWRETVVTFVDGTVAKIEQQRRP